MVSLTDRVRVAPGRIPDQPPHDHKAARTTRLEPAPVHRPERRDKSTTAEDHRRNVPATWCTSTAVARTKKRGAKTGYVFLHSAIDGYSRLAYTEVLPDEKAVTAVAFLDRARADTNASLRTRRGTTGRSSVTTASWLESSSTQGPGIQSRSEPPRSSLELALQRSPTPWRTRRPTARLRDTIRRQQRPGVTASRPRPPWSARARRGPSPGCRTPASSTTSGTGCGTCRRTPTGSPPPGRS